MTDSPEDKYCTLTQCKIVFCQGDFNGIELFEYKYNDVGVIFWKESFDSVGEEPMIITMTISAAIQEVKGVTLIKSWQESWVPPSEKAPYKAVEIANNEPNFLGFHFEDSNKNRIPQSSIKPNDEIVLVLETENATDDTITINLDDDNLDYKHNRTVLKNDLLKEIIITGKHTKIPLTAIKQQKLEAKHA